METTTAHQIPKFHKRATGLYGTSIWRELRNWEFLYSACCDRVEVCIDGYTDRDGWFVRYVCEHDHFTDILGEWFPTLRAAKEWMTANPEWIF